MALLSIWVAPKATFALNDLRRCKYSGKFSALGSLQGETSQILHSTVCREGTYQIYCICLCWPNKAGSQQPIPFSNHGFILLWQPNENGKAYDRRLYFALLVPITRFKVFCLHAQRTEAKSLHACNYLGTTSKKVCFSHLESICL